MRTCWAFRSASEYTAIVVTPSRRAVRAIRHTISPRLAINSRRIIALCPIPISHAKHAEARGCRFLRTGQRERQPQDFARVERIDDPIVPKPRGGVVRMSLALELLA